MLAGTGKRAVTLLFINPVKTMWLSVSGTKRRDSSGIVAGDNAMGCDFF